MLCIAEAWVNAQYHMTPPGGPHTENSFLTLPGVPLLKVKSPVHTYALRGDPKKHHNHSL